jgi:signal transduction histidine kinase/ligand-binding sensor domain-containing protein
MTRLSLFIGAAVLAWVQTCPGQRSVNWRVHKIADGLPDSGCVSVTIGANGKVLAQHLRVASVSELDGYSVSVLPAPPGGARSGRIYESPGGQLWCVAPEGLRLFKDGAWVLFPVPEMAAQFVAGGFASSQAIPIRPVRQGIVLVLLSDRLMQFNAESLDQSRTESLRAASATRLKKFLGLTPARDGGLWISGEAGLAKVPAPLRALKAETEWLEFVPPASLNVHSLREPHEDDEGGVVTVAEDSETRQNVIARFDGREWTKQTIGSAKIRHAWRGPEKTLWAMTTDALLQFEPGGAAVSEHDEISVRQFFDVAVESGGGTFWLATSDGLFHYTPPCWRSPGSIRKVPSPIHGVVEDARGTLWFVSAGSLHALEDGRHEAFALPGAAAIRNMSSSRVLFPLKDASLLLDAGGRLFRFQPGRGEFTEVQSKEGARRFKVLGRIKDGELCVQGFAGDGAETDLRLEIYDGASFRPFPNPVPDDNSIGRFTTIFAAQNGDFWLGAETGVAWYHGQKWQTFTSNDKSSPDSVTAFAELADGKIWCATPDRVWEFNGRNWSSVLGGFDRVNDLLRARDGSIWVASNSGLHRFLQNAWIENGLEEGLSSLAIGEILEDQRGRLWAATTRGLNLYHPTADTEPPRTRIQNLTDKERNVPEAGTISLTFAAEDKWKYTARDRMLFSYRLDERDWSPFQPINSVPFTDLPPGKHYFQARSMDRNGNIDTAPDQLEFAVIVPWYREKRLVLISAAGATVALFFAGLAFNRHRQLLRSYAEVERKVAQRTQELEIASRELLHSQKMNALGTLAAGIAHDFNNILSIVKGSAQIIEENVENSQKVRTRVDRIKTVVEQGSGIVKAMLGFSRSSDQQPARCDLNAVVDDTIKLLGDRFLREVEVVFERTADLPEVAALRDLIQQVLLNFIFNAAEAMAATDARKQIILTTQPLEKPPDGLVLLPVEAAKYMSISVHDFGCGIPAENMPRIFEPFFTTKALSTRRGTGLGLSMVYELAKKMGAGLAVESIVDRGSTFTLILPVRDLPAEAPVETHATELS